eukprot:14994347-Alexandrium_andersonii.AAC.1
MPPRAQMYRWAISDVGSEAGWEVLCSGARSEVARGSGDDTESPRGGSGSSRIATCMWRPWC